MSEDQKGKIDEELLSAAEVAEQRKLPVLAAWLESYVNLNDLRLGVFDELELIANVGKMLADTSRFAFEPEELLKIKAAYQRATEAQKANLKELLKRQMERLQRILNNPDFKDIEKNGAELKRFIAKAEAELANLESSMSQNIERGQGVNKRLVGKKFNYGVLYAFFEFTDDPDKPVPPRHSQLERAKKISAKIEDFKNKLSLVVQRYEIRNKALSILESTQNRLGGLDVISEPETVMPKAPDLKPANIVPEPYKLILEALESEVRMIPPELEEKLSVPKPRDSRPKGQTISEVSAVKPGDERVMESDEFNFDILRLRELICFATESNLKIRILSAKDRIRNYKGGWNELFNELGFDGKVEMVTYRDLNRATDVITPVIVPKGLNTHHSFWERQKFENCVVLNATHPNTLLNHLKAAEEVLQKEA